MTNFGRPSTLLALSMTMLGCGGNGSATGGAQNDGSNGGTGNQGGYLVIGQNQPLLSSEDLLSFRTAQAWTITHELVIGGQRLIEEYQDGSRSFFTYTGFERNIERPFELKFIGAHKGQRVELLSATGSHTFKTYVSSTCKPNRADDCSNVQESDDTSTSIEQELEISAVRLLHCDDDGIDNLTEIYFDTDPCSAVSDQPQGDVAAAVPLQPAINAVLENSDRYTFSFQGSVDTQHTDYVVKVYGGESGNTQLGSSTPIPVMANRAADYSISIPLNLSSGGNYNWRVFGISPDLSSRPLSPVRAFSVANAVPSLTSTLPNANSIKSFVSAETGHLFRFNSTTDAGVQEYRVHLTDETNNLDYGYKRITADGNNSGGSYSTTRNLALRQGGRHRWYVSANSASGDVLTQTPTQEFTIETVQTVVRNISLSTPSNNASLLKVAPTTGYNFNFSSNTNDGVAEYRVYLRDTSNGTNYDFKRMTAHSANNYTVTRNLNLASGANHTWYVTANNATGEQLDQSPERTFSIETAQVTTVLDTTDARNTATREYLRSTVGHVFYFSSSSDTGVSNYRVYLEEIDGPNYGYKLVPAGNSSSGNTYNTTRNLALNAGKTHRFYVSAHDVDGNEVSRSTVSTFTVEQAGEIEISPTSPTGTVAWASQSIGYEFSFAVINDIDVMTYQVHVQDTDTPTNFFYKEIDAAANTANGVVRTTRQINTNEGTQHDWYVTAHDAAGLQLAQSATLTFRPTSPTLSDALPAEGSSVNHSTTGYDFTFRSSDNSGVSEYRVYVFDITNNDGSFDYKTVPTNAASGPSNYNVHRNIDLKAGSSNRWRVSALDAAGIEMNTTEWFNFVVP